jgi:hypothetical protein
MNPSKVFKLKRQAARNASNGICYCFIIALMLMSLNGCSKSGSSAAANNNSNNSGSTNSSAGTADQTGIEYGIFPSNSYLVNDGGNPSTLSKEMDLDGDGHLDLRFLFHRESYVSGSTNDLRFWQIQFLSDSIGVYAVYDSIGWTSNSQLPNEQNLPFSTFGPISIPENQLVGAMSPLNSNSVYTVSPVGVVTANPSVGYIDSAFTAGTMTFSNYINNGVNYYQEYGDYDFLKPGIQYIGLYKLDTLKQLHSGWLKINAVFGTAISNGVELDTVYFISAAFNRKAGATITTGQTK